MSIRMQLMIAGGLLVLGLAGLGTAGVLLSEGPTAEARLAITVQANPNPDTFAQIAQGSDRIVTTLQELATFDTFRETVLRSGFAMSMDLFGATPEERRQNWERMVRVERVGDSLVLHVTARAATNEDALTLAGATLHALATEAPRIIGNHVVLPRIERMPTLMTRVPRSWIFALAGGSGAVTLLGGIAAYIAWRSRRTSSSARPTSLGTLVRPQRSSPEEAKYWLQKFLEQHQSFDAAQDKSLDTARDKELDQVRSKPFDRAQGKPENVTSWDDVAGPERPQDRPG